MERPLLLPNIPFSPKYSSLLIEHSSEKDIKISRAKKNKFQRKSIMAQRRRTATPAQTPAYKVALTPEMSCEPHTGIRRDAVTSLHRLLVGYPDGGINSYGRAVEQGDCLMDQKLPDTPGSPSVVEKTSSCSGFAWSGSTD
jgi:hypothetical protein